MPAATGEDDENARSFSVFSLVAVAGWMNRKQQQTIEYLREANRVLREQLGDRQLRFVSMMTNAVASPANAGRLIHRGSLDRSRLAALGG